MRIAEYGFGSNGQVPGDGGCRTGLFGYGIGRLEGGIFVNLAHYPLRAAIGAFVLNSGLSKRSLEGEAAEGVHGMAVGAIPPLKQFPPATFARLLSGTEIALGAALLLPIVPSAVVGAGLCGFSAGLLRLYWATPGMHEPGDPRPTQQGIPLAKDVWLFGAGLTLILDDLIRGRRGVATC